MTVKRLLEILNKSADRDDIIVRQFYDEKKDKMETEEVTEITIRHYEDSGGYVEIW